MTEPTLSHIPALHAVARRPDGQKSLSRRSLSAAGVVVVHIILLLIFWIKPISPKIETGRAPIETVILLSPADKDTPAPPELKDKEEPKGNGLPQTTAPLLIPPPKMPTQQELDAEVLGGLGRSFACTAGQFEYLAESARKQCSSLIVPWKLDPRDLVIARQIKPTDPDKAEIHLNAAESTRRVMETSDGCVPGASGPANDACRTLHPKGVPVPPGGGVLDWKF